MNLDISEIQGLEALVLHSGGLDSTTALWRALHDFGFRGNVGSISVDYDQRHKEAELSRAQGICDNAGIRHLVVRAPAMPKSMLTDPTSAVPEVSYAELTGVSPTYVPFRNGLLLSYLAAIAQAAGAKALYIGAHAEDAKNDAYPDCTLHFIGAMGAAIYIGTYHQVRLHAPLIEMTKAEVVQLGHKLGAPLDMTWSCYKGGLSHCGTCPTCRARKAAFADAGVYDFTVYASQEVPGVRD